jgi:hypothetical protein
VQLHLRSPIRLYVAVLRNGGNFTSSSLPSNNKSRHSSVGIAMGYGMDYRGSRVRLPSGAGNFSLHHRVQNGSGAHSASYAMALSLG